MSEYAFDASVSVDAGSREEAADLILEHLMEKDIACSLYDEGVLNTTKHTALLDRLKSMLTSWRHDYDDEKFDELEAIIKEARDE